MSKRPETPDDLPSWDRVETLATFVLTNDAIQCGLLPAINAVVQAYCRRNDSMIRVENSYGGALEITQFRAPDVVAARLEQAQAKWDEEHRPLTAPEPRPQHLADDQLNAAVDDRLRSIVTTPSERCGEDDGAGNPCDEPVVNGFCPHHGEVGPPLPPADPHTMAVFGGIAGAVTMPVNENLPGHLPAEANPEPLSYSENMSEWAAARRAHPDSGTPNPAPPGWEHDPR